VGKSRSVTSRTGRKHHFVIAGTHGNVQNSITGVQLFEFECIQEKIIFRGYFMIYLGETIGKAEGRRQSKAITWAEHTNITVVLSALSLSYN
jgi:hypothetical protein